MVRKRVWGGMRCLSVLQMLLLGVKINAALPKCPGSCCGCSGWAPAKALQDVRGKSRKMKPLGADHLTGATPAASAAFKLLFIAIN